MILFYHEYHNIGLSIEIVFITTYANWLLHVITMKEIKPLLTFYIKYHKFDWTVWHVS